MVGTEILELRTVLEHVVDGREQRGRNRTGRLLCTSAPAKAEELCVEVAAFFACGRLSTLDQQGLEPGAPFRKRVERRLPALSSLRGHSPAQDNRCPAVGNRLMSRPISDRMIRADNTSMPGIVIRSKIRL
jgi:hypothetical protein